MSEIFLYVCVHMYVDLCVNKNKINLKSNGMETKRNY